MRALLHWIVPGWLVRGLGLSLLLIGLLGPWGYLWRRARRHRPEPPPAAAVRPVMVALPVGRFQMGSPDGVGDADEHPRHEVVLKHRFALSETEVTQAQYQRVMDENPSRFKGDGDLPVENVSWLDAVMYCNKLSGLEKLDPCYKIQGESVDWIGGELDCQGYRLPTEAEWEYAARADQDTTYAGSNTLDEVGWYSGNSDRRTHLVASKKPNAWGLYDMSGNVWEWVWDWKDAYHAGPDPDPIGPKSGQYRVARGGSWIIDAVNARVAYRFLDPPGLRIVNLGFRLARSLH